MNSNPDSASAQATPPPVQRTIARNTLWNVAGRAWDAISALILTPYIVWRIGLDDYGVWGLVGSFAGYVALLDLGLGSGYAKFIAEYAARNERQRISRLITTALFSYALLGIALAALVLPVLGVAAGKLGALLGVSQVDTGTLVFLVQFSFTLFLLGNCIAPFTSVQSGLQRMDLTNAVGFAMSLIKVISTVALLESGFGLRGLMYSAAIVLAVYAATSVVITFRLIPDLRITPAGFSRTEFGNLFTYGWRAQVARLSNLITFETDLLIVGIVFKSTGLLGAYKVGVELANKVRQVPLMLIGALLPAASDLDAREDERRLQRLYVVSTKYIAAVTVPLAVFCVCVAQPIMRAWMGAGLDQAGLVFALIILGYAANILQGPGISVALGMGRPDVQMRTGLLSMFCNIALTIAFVYPFGYVGVATATALSMYASMAWFLIAMRSLTRVRVAVVVWEAMLWPTLASLPGAILCVFIHLLFPAGDDRMMNLGIVVVTASVFAASYALCIRQFPFLDAFDVEFLERTLRLRAVPGFAFMTRRARNRTPWAGVS
ncbi:MAG: oligosaccharide flippase family protein [Candidatus Hydrogenedentes bacterium]|nr:oligosaccharide flippase family protein [Candidatus Hydrogenedentota bacterium]